jgi:RNA polymerase sigma-70 factor (ECF subfamily)
VPIFSDRPDLLARFRAGERAALEEVYWAYVERVETIVRRGFAHVAGAPAHEVRDVVHEAFVRAFAETGRRGFDGLRDYGPFLSTLARHALADWWRRNGRQLPVADVASAIEAAQRADPTEPDPAWDDDPALVQAVEDYLAGLSADLRAAHRELYVLGRSQRQAAEALGVSRQSLRTVESRLRRGLAVALRRKGLRP